MLSKKIKLNVKGKEYDIEIKQLTKDTTKIKVDEKEFVFKEEERDKGAVAALIFRGTKRLRELLGNMGESTND